MFDCKQYAMLILLLFSIFSTKILAQDCSFTVSPTSPVITNDDFTFPSSFDFNLNQPFYIKCPEGTYNFLISPEGDQVLCKRRTHIYNTRTLEFLDYNDLRCNFIPPTVVQKLDEKCENNGTIIEVGFKMQQKVVPEFTICFNEKKLTPFYTKYKNDRLLDVGDLGNFTYQDYVCGRKRPCMFFDSSGIYPNSLDLIYHDQDQILENLGVEIAGTSLVRFPVAQGPLAHHLPQEVQSYAYWDHSNVVLIWDTSIAMWEYSYFAPMDNSSTVRFTGTLGVASLPNADGDSVEVYLDDGKVPVPKWLWMVNERDDLMNFIYNGDSRIFKEESAKVCRNVSSFNNLVACYIEDVIHPDLQEFIQNNLAL